jgi:5-formyltetrahydrofolate cyclo-ligase
MPLDFEVDLRPIIKKYRRYKKNIYIPLIRGNDMFVVKYRLPLSKKQFGIFEAKYSTFNRKIDLAVIPIIGLDKSYKRIGFGKGFYDKFFDKLAYKPIMIFTQLTLCKSNIYLCEDYDIEADYLVTT